jgi:hypothetical protein
MGASGDPKVFLEGYGFKVLCTGKSNLFNVTFPGARKARMMTRAQVEVLLDAERAKRNLEPIRRRR